jgi:prepilin peptidase CpaA
VFPLPESLSHLINWVWTHLYLIVPLFFSLWMAWTDFRTHRIPNLLNIFCALSGFGYQLGARGLEGLSDSLLGLLLGFALMIGFYLLAGMGAGDVKALAALGSWLGPWNTLLLFIFMGLSGLPLVIIFLWYRGHLFTKLRQFWTHLKNLALTRSKGAANTDKTLPAPEERIPYAVAIALGMILLCFSTLTKIFFPIILK